MSHTQAIINFFKLAEPLPTRYFARNLQNYKVVYHQAIESQPKLVARFQDGIIEIPQSAIANGFGVTAWKGKWHQIPEEEFLKDFGKSYTAHFGTVDYSA